MQQGPTVGTVEMEEKKKRDYVNDTELGDQPPPLYAPVPGKEVTIERYLCHTVCCVSVQERLRAIPTKHFNLHVQSMHGNKDAKFEAEYEVHALTFDPTQASNNALLSAVTRE